MSKYERARRAVQGAALGLLAGLAMVTVQLLLRSFLALASPPELVGDRLAAAVPVALFGDLIRFAGGYNELKQLGVISVIVGQVVVATLIGAIAGLAADRRARAVVIGAGVILWFASIVLLWPTLATHFGGLPSPLSPIATAAGLATSYATFVLTLLWLRRQFAIVATGRASPVPAPARPIGRRVVLASGLGLGLLATSGTLLERLRAKATFSYDGLRVDGPEIGPITPNDRFYVVTKNIVDPDVIAGLWRIEVGGLVDRPLIYDLDAIESMPAVEQETTLMCISNPIGGGLMSNAIWTGIPLADLLTASGPRAGAVELLCHAVDGYTDTIPFAKAMEPTTILAYRMNGDPLPTRHGFPARLVIPGMYGEKSLKWVDRLEVVDRDVKGFYEQQGWGPDFVIPTRSRISGPDLRQPVPAGQPIRLVGQAFGGDRGVSAVEVSLDGGATWAPAEIDYAGTKLTWALWSFMWTPTGTGEVRLTVRATDGQGELQSSTGAAIVPQGARGLHSIKATVA